MEVVGLVTARGGSQRLPRKNVLPLAGKPMIAWTIEAALQSEALTRVIVSTDDEEIARVSREYGAEVPFSRPTELAEADSDHVAVVEHALDWLAEHEGVQPDWVLLLQPTSPLRTAEDIDACVALARESAAPAVVSVTAPTATITPNGALYLSRVASLRAERRFVPPGTIAYSMPTERSVDVDTAEDFALAEAALRERSR